VGNNGDVSDIHKVLIPDRNCFFNFLIMNALKCYNFRNGKRGAKVRQINGRGKQKRKLYVLLIPVYKGFYGT
jgi:hypothetical protein